MIFSDKTIYIAEKLIYPFWADAIRLYENGIGTFEDIDKVCKFGFGHPKGPFEMMDETGLDTVAQTLKTFYEKTGNKRFSVPALLSKMIDEGIIGKKIGRGFYSYTQAAPDIKKDEISHKERPSIGIQKVGVIGFGTMGRGIAQVIAEHGFEVVVKEVNEDAIEKGIDSIEGFLEISLSKGKITGMDKKKIMERIKGTTDMEELKDSDIVIEAVFEKMDLKKDIFAQIDNIVKPEAILATNTSCLSVTEISTATKRPDKVCGLHFFNPVPLMKLVEVIRATKTSEETFKKAISFGILLGKEPVQCKDSPGFIANRLLCPYLFHTIQEYDDGLAPKEEIDSSIKLAAGFPMGPLRLADLVGLDVCLAIGEAMFKEIGDPDLAPPPLLIKMVNTGYLGKKTGKGFYDYTLV